MLSELLYVDMNEYDDRTGHVDNISVSAMVDVMCCSDDISAWMLSVARQGVRRSAPRRSAHSGDKVE